MEIKIYLENSFFPFYTESLSLIISDRICCTINDIIIIRFNYSNILSQLDCINFSNSKTIIKYY